VEHERDPVAGPAERAPARGAAEAVARLCELGTTEGTADELEQRRLHDGSAQPTLPAGRTGSPQTRRLQPLVTLDRVLRPARSRRRTSCSASSAAARSSSSPVWSTTSTR